MFTFDEENEIPGPAYNGVAEIENEIIETQMDFVNSEEINETNYLEGKISGLIRAIELIKIQETIEINSRPWGPF